MPVLSYRLEQHAWRGLQKANMNAWEVHLHFQHADRALKDLIDDLDSEAAKAFAALFRKRLRFRIFSVKAAQEARAHDFRLLNPESEVAGYPRAVSVFSKKLTARAARSH
ncbi:hypothetical protein Pmar_PMAR000538 [Perkinsus marinus ATCC 50983]|uniref:Uncharacterized protein n=1 Tax=Perkinsus marinus (strain ATCC 50983 / TXsc) TaxID=423536 RepID=C5LIW6_PERM5|nr:hypothetical protein Pmar_PMAR000538 [Perkinsus marinus ATCC 50983]EER03301.1 hypothetical protein Pmar_PMAR000538 [Perkinsus marinus ATCC 50983]|eukprot:XP_002771485.1 hypothetical protein Pmar_PMAR000538 [Perkinsus marinus ATCC 50983]